MTLYEIKQAVANYLGVTVSDLTINGTDMFLMAVNQVRRDAEQNWDFEFQRRLVDVTVDGVTGGDLTDAVLHSDGTTAVKVKTVIEVGQYDDDDNLRPAEWTTVAEGLERQREDNKYNHFPRYPTDGDFEAGPRGQTRFEFVGDTIYRWPLDSENDYTIGIEAYTYAADWTTAAAPTATVTGTLSPNVTGTYTYLGLDANSLAIYYKVVSSVVSTFLTYSNGNWKILYGVLNYEWNGSVSSGTVAGSYTAAGSATGTATVAVTANVEDVWTIHGHQYLIWATIVHLNYYFKVFVPRTEGNLPPPVQLAEQGLASLKAWDSAKYEQHRRHGRV